MATLIEPIHRLARPQDAPPSAGTRRVTWSFSDEWPTDDPRILGEFPESAAEQPSPLPSVLSGVRVLVVEDDEDTRELFAAALTACGAEVATASRALEALHLLTAGPAHVVLSDIAMPGGDGYWLVQEIRRLPDASVKNVPVVAVTAYGREHSRARALAAGFANHLQKPVDPEVLCRTVAMAAGR
jgi:CheY-like chemotaxis protein